MRSLVRRELQQTLGRKHKGLRLFKISPPIVTICHPRSEYPAPRIIGTISDKLFSAKNAKKGLSNMQKTDLQYDYLTFRVTKTQQNNENQRKGASHSD